MIDRRLHAFRDDLADIRLKGSVGATRFVEGELRQVVSSIADIKRAPSLTAPLESQARYGETVLVFEEKDGYCWSQLTTDGYVGYIEASCLSIRIETPNYRVSAPRTFIYAQPDLKLPMVCALSMGSLVCVVDEVITRETRYLKLATGEYIIAHHLSVNEDFEGKIDKACAQKSMDADPVAVASRLIHTPYLWGGRSTFGIDCSALVQLSYALCGDALPRDSDMQRAHVLETDAPLQRGDLLFWKGHVAMMESASTIIHASGHAMAVVIEPYDEVVRRYGEPILKGSVK
jgi:cell wall-associated NlpC family hydrolase